MSSLPETGRNVSQLTYDRHGCYNGATGRVQDPQFTILQAHIRLPFNWFRRTGTANPPVGVIVPYTSLQSKLLLADSDGIMKTSRGRPKLKLHTELETYLGRYSGLMLYLKEMDEGVYEKLCVVSFSRSGAFLPI